MNDFKTLFSQSNIFPFKRFSSPLFGIPPNFKEFVCIPPLMPFLENPTRWEETMLKGTL